jgi:hypothetical protein
MSLDDDEIEKDANEYRKAQAARIILDTLSEEELSTKPKEYVDELRRLVARAKLGPQNESGR